MKFIAPYKMSPLYPYPAILPPEIYAGPVIGILILAFIYIAFKKDWRPYLFGFLFFLFNVMFLLQVVGAGQAFLADRFTYIPYMGLIFMVVYAGQWLAKNKPSAAKPAVARPGRAHPAGGGLMRREQLLRLYPRAWR